MDIIIRNAGDVPIYEQIVRQIKSQILRGELGEGDALPSMRLLAKDYFALEMAGEAERWIFRAVGEAPHLREPWLDLADLAYHQKDWHGVLWATGRALAITQRPRTYISEAASWGEHPWDLASLGYFYTGQYEKALEAARKARDLAPDNPRIQKNLQLIEGKLAPA